MRVFLLQGLSMSPAVPPLQLLAFAVGRPRSDAAVSVSTTHAERPQLNTTVTTAFTAGEGYQSSAISTTSLPLPNLQEFYEDLPNTVGGMLNSIWEFRGSFRKPDSWW